MSPHDRPTRTSRTILAFAAAFAVVACTGKAPPTVAPSDAPRRPPAPPRWRPPEPIAQSDDAGLVTGRSGADGLQLILASTGERILALPVGVPAHDWSHVVSTDTTGASTTIRDLRLRSPSRRARRSTAPGACRPSASTRPPSASPTTAARSSSSRMGRLPAPGRQDGLSLRPRRPDRGGGRADRRTGRRVRVRRALARWLDPLRRGAPRRAARRSLPGSGARHGDRQLRDGAVADKNEGDEAMAGWPIAQARRPDGMVFTLYRGAEHPFIHALSSVDAWALCIDLPTTGTNDAAAAPTGA